MQTASTGRSLRLAAKQAPAARDILNVAGNGSSRVRPGLPLHGAGLLPEDATIAVAQRSSGYDAGIKSLAPSLGPRPLAALGKRMSVFWPFD